MDKNLKIALILSAQDKASAILGRAFTNAEKHAKAIERTAKGFGEVGDKSMIAGGAITALFAKTVYDARQSEIEQKKLINGFVTMGSTAAAAQKAMDFANEQQMVIGIDDDKIMAVQGKLATFGRAMDEHAQKSGVFNRATIAAFDMQEKGFGDALNNITQLGKALQNPALGAQALAKAGAINKEDMPGIKYLQQTKGIWAAQEFLLKAIEKQVKGTAKAAADPIKILELEFAETSKALGKQLLPEVNQMARSFAKTLPRIIDFVEKHKDLIVTIAKAGVGLLVFGGAMKVIGLGISGVGTAFKIAGGLIKGAQFITGIAGIGSEVFKAGDKLNKFREYGLKVNDALKTSILPAIKKAGIAFMEFGATLLANPITWYIAAAVALAAAVYLIIKNWDKISAFFRKLWQGVKQTFVSFWNFGKKMFLNFTPGGLIIKHWSKLANFFTGIWDKVKQVFTNAWNWVMNLGGKFFDAGKNIVESIWRGMKMMAMKPVAMIMSITQKIRNFLPFSPAKEGALKDIHRIKLVETIAKAMTAKPLIHAWQDTTGDLYRHMNQPVFAFANAGSGGGGSAPQFNITIHIGNGTKAEATTIFDNLKPKLDKWWREKQHQSGRIGFN